MNKSHKSPCDADTLPDYQNKPARRSGDVRAVKTDGEDARTDQTSGMAEAVQEAIEASFGR